MTYAIVLQPAARAQAAAIYAYLYEHSPTAAERWLAGFERALRSLETMPARCPLAPEKDRFTREVRQLLYERYRVVFTILGASVRVLHVRHTARDVLGRDE